MPARDCPAEWSERLRAARGARSREDLAAVAGLSSRTIQSIEHGEARPHRATRLAIAAALGTAVADLFPPVAPQLTAAASRGRADAAA